MQIRRQTFQSRIYEDWLLLQSERVVPLVNLTFGEGEDVDLSKATIGTEVDHFYEVILLVLLIIH